MFKFVSLLPGNKKPLADMTRLFGELVAHFFTWSRLYLWRVSSNCFPARWPSHDWVQAHPQPGGWALLMLPLEQKPTKKHWHILSRTPFILSRKWCTWTCTKKTGRFHGGAWCKVIFPGISQTLFWAVDSVSCCCCTSYFTMGFMLLISFSVFFMVLHDSLHRRAFSLDSFVYEWEVQCNHCSKMTLIIHLGHTANMISHDYLVTHLQMYQHIYTVYGHSFCHITPIDDTRYLCSISLCFYVCSAL